MRLNSELAKTEPSIIPAYNIKRIKLKGGTLSFKDKKEEFE